MQAVGKKVLRLPLRLVTVKKTECCLGKQPWTIALCDEEFNEGLAELAMATYNLEQAKTYGDVGRVKEFAAKQGEISQKIENALQKHGLTIDDLLK